MDRFLEFVGVFGRNHTVISVEQVAFAIAFENFAKHPAVAVRIAKLNIL